MCSRPPSTGLPPAARLSYIIMDIFRNEEYCVNNVKTTSLSSKCNLTSAQINQLTYAPEFTPCNIYILYQVSDGTTTTLQLISFVRKNNYIYGIYFDVNNQTPFSYSDLVCNCNPVTLVDSVQLVYSDYLEVYFDINGTTILLGFDSDSNNSSLQYSDNCRYFYSFLSNTGLDENNPKVYVTGLSRNLSCYKTYCV